MWLESYVCISSKTGTDRVQYRVRGLLDAPDVVDVTEHATYDVHQAHMETMKQVMKQDPLYSYELVLDSLFYPYYPLCIPRAWCDFVPHWYYGPIAKSLPIMPITINIPHIPIIPISPHYYDYYS